MGEKRTVVTLSTERPTQSDGGVILKNRELQGGRAQIGGQERGGGVTEKCSLTSAMVWEGGLGGSVGGDGKFSPP